MFKITMNLQLIRTGFACAMLFAAFASHADPILTVSTGGGQLANVDVATGTTTVLGNTGVVLTDIAFSPTGDLFGISFNDLYKVNPTTGATTLVGSLGGVSGTETLLCLVPTAPCIWPATRFTRSAPPPLLQPRLDRSAFSRAATLHSSEAISTWLPTVTS